MWLNESKTYTLQFVGSSWNHYLFSKRVAFNSSVGESLAFISPSAVMETSALATWRGNKSTVFLFHHAKERLG